MASTVDPPALIHSRAPEGEAYRPFLLRDTPHNGRPAWDRGLHHSLCWTPYDDQTEYGFWSVADLWTTDEEGQATGIVFQTPEQPHLDGPEHLPPTATSKWLPPLGAWTRGRPWVGDRTTGGRVEVLFV